jgi:hypothetical protein
MFYVGVLSVSEAVNPGAVAAELEVSDYDVRQWAFGVLPRIAFVGNDRDAAQARFESLHRHGYGAALLDANSLHTDVAPVLVRRLYVDGDSIGTDGATGPIRRLDALELVAHVAVKQRSEKVTRSHPKVRSITHTSYATNVEHIERSQTAEHMLFLFARGEQMPWLIRESSTRFLGLGASMGRSSIENLRVTLALLRTRAGAASIDERFATAPIGIDTALTNRAAGFQTRVQALVQMLRMSWSAHHDGAYRRLAPRET